MVNAIIYKNRKAIEITNDTIRLVVIPAIARIVHYSFVDQENILFLTDDFEDLKLLAPNEYIQKGIRNTHFGGDRVLTSSEDYFHLLTGSRFIADPWLTSSPYTYHILPNGVEITSPVSELLGVQLTRKITIEESGCKVFIDQKLEKIRDAKTSEVDAIPLTIWNLTQIKLPKKTWMPLQDDSVFENGFDIPVWPDGKNWAGDNYEVKNGLLAFSPDTKYPQKIGADAKGCVAGLVDNVLIVEKFIPLKDVNYPDGGTSATVFTCPDFAELECLSPEKILKPGDVMNHSIQWELIKISDEREVVDIFDREQEERNK